MAARYKILMLDDEQEVLDLYRELLQQLPSKPEVHVSSSGARAIAVLESEPFNLLITDLRMPGMDGVELIQHLRRIRPDQSVIVMTAYATSSNAIKATQNGAFDYITKPINDEHLALLILELNIVMIFRPVTTREQQHSRLRSATVTLANTSPRKSPAP